MNEQIALISESYSGATTPDDYGDSEPAETSVMRFAEIMSVGQTEFYQASAAGMKPEIKFRLSDYLDYDGQMLVEYNGVRYRVLRTYRSGKALEITCYSQVNN